MLSTWLLPRHLRRMLKRLNYTEKSTLKEWNEIEWKLPPQTSIWNLDFQSAGWPRTLPEGTHIFEHILHPSTQFLIWVAKEKDNKRALRWQNPTNLKQYYDQIFYALICNNKKIRMYIFLFYLYQAWKANFSMLWSWFC